MAKKLRHGYTTGACATAATLGAALMLARQESVEAVTLSLPAGDEVTFPLKEGRFTAERASACVIKDAGDDPDVTHGCELWAKVERLLDCEDVELVGGTGIGRVTRPGLAVAVGEWAINPVPRQMIIAAVRTVFPTEGVRVTLSIPDGEARAQKTLNERLGIIGGLSLLGTTGVVTPVSHRAWTDTLDVALDVAVASGAATILFSTGRNSEKAAQKLLQLDEVACVMMGDYVGHAVSAAAQRGIPHLVLAAQFAKLVKIACGHRQTHVRSSTLDLTMLATWGAGCGLDAVATKRIELANTAREVLDQLGGEHPLIEAVVHRARQALAPLAPASRIDILLVGYDNRPPWSFAAPRSAEGGVRG